MNTLLAIAAGGATGAVMRHGYAVLVMKMFGNGFPYHTLAVNIIGSFLMGVLIVVFAQIWQPPAEMRAFLITGFLGAFTTFSAFSLDVSVLYERGDMMLSGLYIAVSVGGAVLALFAGMALVRGIVA